MGSWRSSARGSWPTSRKFAPAKARARKQSNWPPNCSSASQTTAPVSALARTITAPNLESGAPPPNPEVARPRSSFVDGRGQLVGHGRSRRWGANDRQRLGLGPVHVEEQKCSCPEPNAELTRRTDLEKNRTPLAIRSREGSKTPYHCGAPRRARLGQQGCESYEYCRRATSRHSGCSCRHRRRSATAR